MHQYLFFIGDFPIRAYGVMLALAIIRCFCCVFSTQKGWSRLA